MANDSIKLFEIKTTKPENWLNAAFATNSIKSENKRMEAIYHTYNLRTRNKF